MNNMNFLKGMGIGLMIGAAATAGMTIKPKKKHCNMIGKALKSMGEVIDGIADSMGM